MAVGKDVYRMLRQPENAKKWRGYRNQEFLLADLCNMLQWSANLELPRRNQQNVAGVWDERKKELIQIKAVICPENKWIEETLDNKGIVRDIWD